MAITKYGSSAVTWSLPVRILLSTAALIPVLLVASGLASMSDPLNREIGAAFMLSIGGTSMCLIPRYLSSVWRPRPAWLVEQRLQRIREAQLEDELGKWPEEPSPPTTTDAPPLIRRRW